MHTKPMSEHQGTFQPPEAKRYRCLECKQQSAICRLWESSCGGYEDYKYACQNTDCRFSWWVEGSDS